MTYTELTLDKTVSKKLKMLLISPLENTPQNIAVDFTYLPYKILH